MDLKRTIRHLRERALAAERDKSIPLKKRLQKSSRISSMIRKLQEEHARIYANSEWRDFRRTGKVVDYETHPW